MNRLGLTVGLHINVIMKKFAANELTDNVCTITVDTSLIHSLFCVMSDLDTVNTDKLCVCFRLFSPQLVK